MKAWVKMWRASAGSTAIEFGILAPVLVAMSFGVYEFGRWAWTLEALQESATQGARCVGIGQSACESSGAYNSSSTAKLCADRRRQLGHHRTDRRHHNNQQHKLRWRQRVLPGPDQLRLHHGRGQGHSGGARTEPR